VSRVTWATSVPILVFLGPSVLELGLMYATDTDVRRQTDRRQTKASLNASALWERMHNNGTGILMIRCANVSHRANIAKWLH